LAKQATEGLESQTVYNIDHCLFFKIEFVDFRNRFSAILFRDRLKMILSKSFRMDISGSVDVVQVLPTPTKSDGFAFAETEAETGLPILPVVVVHRRRDAVRRRRHVRRRDGVGCRRRRRFVASDGIVLFGEFGKPPLRWS